MQNNETENLHNYSLYLDLVTKQIETFFENQKEYICCKKGCAGCCKSGTYPYSRLEIDYIKIGLNKLSEDVRDKIFKNLDTIKQEYSKKLDAEFLYQCPFLINDSCSVYQYRGIICRTFGLITENASGKLTIPYCSNDGLNYSKVYDKDKKMILTEKV